MPFLKTFFSVGGIPLDWALRCSGGRPGFRLEDAHPVPHLGHLSSASSAGQGVLVLEGKLRVSFLFQAVACLREVRLEKTGIERFLKGGRNV